jgi:NCS2 family nucleobase:cation symporter-2
MAEERAQRDAHAVDEVLPVGRMMAFALQHVLSMYAGIIAVPLILATAIRLPQEELVYVINASFFMCGVAAGIQTLSRVDLTDNGNLVTVAVSVAFGVIPSAVPELYDRGSHKVSG